MRGGRLPATWATVWLTIASVACGLSSAPRLAAQMLSAGEPETEYLRVLQMLGRAGGGSLMVLPIRAEGGIAALADGAHPWAARYPKTDARDHSRVSARRPAARLRSFTNTSYPVGMNDGAVWQGKGLTAAFDIVASAAWRGLSVTLAPSLIYTQNASFELGPVSIPNMPEYAYPWRRMDMPQRFGPSSSWTLDPGDSEVRVSAYGASVAFGTTSRWWGPGLRNAIVMSNNAPGFRHVSVGTDGPLDVSVGEIQLQWLFGDLRQSEWFDPAAANMDRFITGILGTYSPSFVSGLTLGMSRVFYAFAPPGGPEVGDYFLVFQDVRKELQATPDNPFGEDRRDQLLSLFGRWVFRDAGFELYWEWARNDHAWDFRDFILDPGHSGASTLGLQKAFELPAQRILVVRAELTYLERSTRTLRPVPTYYYHHIITQGYTHEGQVIGAGIGPGSNSQHLGFDFYSSWGRATLFVERSVRDNDAFYDWAVANNATRWERNIWLHGGTGALVFVGDFDLAGNLVMTRELNRYFIGRDLWNLNLGISARWRPH